MDVTANWYSGMQKVEGIPSSPLFLSQVKVICCKEEITQRRGKWLGKCREVSKWLTWESVGENRLRTHTRSC